MIVLVKITSLSPEQDGKAKRHNTHKKTYTQLCNKKGRREVQQTIPRWLCHLYYSLAEKVKLFSEGLGCFPWLSSEVRAKEGRFASVSDWQIL